MRTEVKRTELGKKSKAAKKGVATTRLLSVSCIEQSRPNSVTLWHGFVLSNNVCTVRVNAETWVVAWFKEVIVDEPDQSVTQWQIKSIDLSVKSIHQFLFKIHHLIFSLSYVYVCSLKPLKLFSSKIIWYHVIELSFSKKIRIEKKLVRSLAFFVYLLLNE